MATRPLRILYAAGPGDVIGTFRHWRAGRDDPGQVSMTYSGQFFDVCRDVGARAYVVSTHSRRESVRDGDFRLVHRPTPFVGRSSALYHLGQVWSALRLLASAVRFRADAMVVVCGTCHWFPLRLAPLLGIRCVPSLHCVLWRRGAPPRRVRAVVARLDRAFFTRTAGAVMSASREIAGQVSELTSGAMRPLFEFMPTYRRSQFDGIAPPGAGRPFRVLFAGRIERNKGVFDVLEIARRFRALGRDGIEFDLCGQGSTLDELRAAVNREGLEARFRCHGHCDKAAMRGFFERCHAVIVPTTSDFVEGFNQVVAEGVLSGRPVVTSSACPALDYVRRAVVEVPVDDVGAYGDALLRLCDDAAFYQDRVEGCSESQAQFYDLSRSWAATLRRVFRSIGLEGTPEPGARIDVALLDALSRDGAHAGSERQPKTADAAVKAMARS